MRVSLPELYGFETSVSSRYAPGVKLRRRLRPGGMDLLEESERRPVSRRHRPSMGLANLLSSVGPIRCWPAGLHNLSNKKNLFFLFFQ